MDKHLLTLVIVCLNMHNDVAALGFYWFDIPRDFRCGKTFDIRKDGQSHIKIASKNFSITCDVTLETFDDDQLMVFFDTLNTSGNSWMELHDGNTSRSPNIGGPCKSKEYKCDNGRCISDSLQCFGDNTCGDHSDCKTFWLTAPEIAGIAIGSAVIFVLVFAGIPACFAYRRKKKKQSGVLSKPALPVTTPDYGYDQPLPEQSAQQPGTTGTSGGITNSLYNKCT